MPSVRDMVRMFRMTQAAAENPPEDPVDASTRLQQFLVAQEAQHDFTEKQLVEIALGSGVPDDQIQDFMDSLATWL